MSGIIPVTWFLLVTCLWGLTIYQSHRLGRKFRAKYPEVAAREIPWAFSHLAHPEKGNFFLRRRAAVLLADDKELWRERRRFIWLCCVSVGFPLFGFLAILLYAIW